MTLIDRLLASPELRARYLAHIRTITEEWLDWSKPEPIIAELEKIGADLEVAVEKRREEENAKEDKLLKSVGMVFVKFSDGDAKDYVEAAYTERWKKLLSKSPELGKRIRALSE